MLTKDYLSQIKTTVRETIQPEIKALGMDIESLKKSMATKEDMRTLEARLKGDMRNMEVRVNDTMKNLETGIKGDMKNLETGIKGDMKNLETSLKNDMKGLEKRLIDRIDEAQMEIIATVDKHKADKSTVDNLEKRVVRLEDNAGLPPYSTQ